MTEVSCLRARPFGIDFQNLAFEIYRSWGNESRIHLPTDRFQSIRSPNDTQLIVERSDSIQILPKSLMLIDTKINHSIILIEQDEQRSSTQTANVTVIFTHQVRLNDFSLEKITHECISFFLVIRITVSMPCLRSGRCRVSPRVHSLCSLYFFFIICLI